MNNNKQWNEFIDKICNKRLKGKFTYEPKTKIEDWIKEIGKPEKKEKYVYEEKGTEVEVITPCYYSVEEKQCEKGDYFIIEDKERLNDLINRG